MATNRCDWEPSDQDYCNEMRANSQAAYVKLMRNVYGNKLSSYQVKILWLEQFYIRILFALPIPPK